MKKITLTVLIATALSVASAFAQDCDYSGTTGPLNWCLKDSTLTISGEGEMPDYDPFGGKLQISYISAMQDCNPANIIEEGPPWFYYSQFIKTIVIESGVANIGLYAFYTCWHAISISIPNSVIRIGEYALCECKSFSSVTIPNSVTSIGNTTFYYCSSLTSINVESENDTYASENGVLFDKNKNTLICCPEGKVGAYATPNSVTSIGKGAFFRCKNLTSINISNSVINIGADAFSDCKNMILITLPNSVTSIGASAFSGCPLTSMIIPNKVTSIEHGTFNYCSIASIIIPQGITSIKTMAFRCCTHLTSMTNLNPVPIEMASDAFSGVNIGACTLQVPTSAVPAYKKTDIWKEFNIVGGGILVNPISNNNGGYTDGDGLYELYATATVAATAFSGYKFVNWTKDGTEVSRNNPYSFTVTEDVELVANFVNNTGIETAESESTMIYPNPFNNYITVFSNDVANITITDISGKVLYCSQLSNGINEIATNHFPNGIFLVKIQNKNNSISVFKILK